MLEDPGAEAQEEYTTKLDDSVGAAGVELELLSPGAEVVTPLAGVLEVSGVVTEDE